MRIRSLFAWYDLWVGAYWDRHNRKLYILPLPCIGVVIEFPHKCLMCGKRTFEPLICHSCDTEDLN